MAKGNTVQLSPMTGGQQEDPAFVEDEIEAGNDGEQSANLLNLGLKSGKKPTRDSKATNVSRRLRRRHAAGQALHHVRDSDNGQDEQGNPAAEEEDESEPHRIPPYSMQKKRQHQTEGNGRIASKKPKFKSHPPMLSAAVANGPKSPEPKKRSRGRPPKARLPESSDSLPEIEALGSHAEDDADEAENDSEPPAAEDEVNDILRIDESQGQKDGDEIRKTLKDVIEIKTLRDLLETAQQVGYRQSKETKELTKKEGTEQNLKSRQGRRIFTDLDLLVKAYDGLRASKTAGDNNTADLAQNEITRLVENLNKDSKVVLERLGSPAHGTRCSKKFIIDVLTDFYFFLVPSFVKVLELVVEIHQDEDFSHTDIIPEILGLLGLLRSLGDCAARQPKDSRPTSNQYRISLPTRSILPEIRSFHTCLQIELRRREKLEDTVARNRDDAERARKKVEEDERESQEKQRRKAEVYRLQQEAIDAKLRHPVYGYYLQAKLGLIEAETTKMQVSGSSQSRQLRNSQISSGQDLDDEDMLDDRFDDQYERISVFGSRNASQSRELQPLSKEEKMIFIKMMQFEHKDVRYENAAERLGRSMEEIFAFAKELQDSMDIAHQNGSMNLACDEWTYDIWIDQSFTRF